MKGLLGQKHPEDYVGSAQTVNLHRTSLNITYWIDYDAISGFIQLLSLLDAIQYPYCLFQFPSKLL